MVWKSVPNAGVTYPFPTGRQISGATGLLALTMVLLPSNLQTLYLHSWPLTPLMKCRAVPLPLHSHSPFSLAAQLSFCLLLGPFLDVCRTVAGESDHRICASRRKDSWNWEQGRSFQPLDLFLSGTALKMQRDRHVWATYSCPVSLCVANSHRSLVLNSCSMQCFHSVVFSISWTCNFTDKASRLCFCHRADSQNCNFANWYK